ncbi:LbtU family siderophore porin [Chlorobium phaeovibrioides]|uniref:LbtU family siderophore porin n=1 Tax=Chlorobium phaeovibrioides TaxID=1094 RepID=A0A5M8IB04_CHLPH|nr:LbtU family siderophore porin [Chlorobium phaeovibrioides]KAA6232170.1 LbtU family siderophore porin [Chlorobium phaeovibrioides]MWV54747.1 LbtU family siderophore porin [Chlorobium phaeovibrioides]QEQ57308.1 LbtU family siderophore porin [Chlorobium phaeovibrioides]RTY34859.1 LbtU family siderophore porin [Chlorobium phaeovibrioides]
MKKMIIAGAALATLGMVPSSALFASDEVLELKRRLDLLENRVEAAPRPEAEKSSITKGLAFGGLVEVEANYQDPSDSKATSDLTLATLELGLEAKVNPWLTAYGVLLYEQGENSDNILVEQAYIRMKSESSPFFAEVGRLTQSFGSFESSMISDPMTLELGESKLHASVKAGYEADGITGSLSVFKGDVQKAGESEINSLVAAFSWQKEVDSFRYGFGASWTNNMADTDGLQDGFTDKKTTDFVGGWSANAIAGYGAFELRGEYLGACDSFTDGEYGGKQPSAWSVEAGYDFEAPFSLAVRYEGADDFETNDSRYAAALGWEVAEGAGLAFEYQRAENKADTADTDTFTMQLAMEF